MTADPRDPATWLWCGFKGHLCVSESCRFGLNTEVNGYRVSTVGAYVSSVSRNHTDYEEVGCDRLYETMVFRVDTSRPAEICGACHPVVDWSEVECKGYNDPAAAVAGHMAMCRKYAALPTPITPANLRAEGEP